VYALTRSHVITLARFLTDGALSPSARSRDYDVTSRLSPSIYTVS